MMFWKDWAIGIEIRLCWNACESSEGAFWCDGVLIAVVDVQSMLVDSSNAIPKKDESVSFMLHKLCLTTSDI
jgi:hypothetical protein